MGESKLRFKADDGSDFPDWEEKTLGEITGLFVGKSFTSELNKNGRYVVMDMGSVSSDGSIIDAKLTDLDRDILRRGDLIMPKDDIGGGLIIGKTAYIPCDDKYVCGDHVYRLRFDSEIDGLFMHYEINSSGPQRRLGRKVTGSAQLGLNSKSVSSETVSVPSLPEQRKIADLLSAVDAVIAAQQAEVDAWEQRKKGVMQKLFSQEVRFKADDGSDFPDWEEKTLGEITGLFVGKSFTSELNKNGRYVVMDMGSVSSDGSIIDAKLTDLDRDILRRGDLIMPKDDIGGGLIIGKTAYIPCDDKYVCGDHVYRLRFDSEIDGLFMHYEINSSGPQRRLGRKVTGSAQLGLNSKSVSSETVSVPSLPEQRKIADCLSSMDEAIQKSKDELAKWQELKKGLLQQMFM